MIPLMTVFFIFITMSFFLLFVFLFAVAANVVLANSFLATVAWLMRADGYPQQPPDFSAEFVTTDADRNFCRQRSLQK
jgi:uncharacterized protein involved in cysteine biosynthesis